MPGDLPETLDELLSTFALSTDDQRVRCSICQESYGASFENEQPVELPGCNHIFGVKCISAWHDKGQNTCPMCRKPFLDAPTTLEEDVDPDERLRQELISWPMAPDSPPGEEPVDELFNNLCEAIVQFIEDPSVDSAEEWLDNRVPFREIIGLGTFMHFAKIVNGPPGYLQRLVNDLAILFPDQWLVELVMKTAREWEHSHEDWLLRADEHTFQRMEDWYRRITMSRDLLYQRLYGMRIQLGRPSP